MDNKGKALIHDGLLCIWKVSEYSSYFHMLNVLFIGEHVCCCCCWMKERVSLLFFWLILNFLLHTQRESLECNFTMQQRLIVRSKLLPVCPALVILWWMSNWNNVIKQSSAFCSVRQKVGNLQYDVPKFSKISILIGYNLIEHKANIDWTLLYIIIINIIKCV